MTLTQDFLDGFSEQRLVEGLRGWVEAESPSRDGAAVNRALDRMQAEYTAPGISAERVAGRDGLGDHLILRKGRGTGPGILILSHADTVHPLGTLDQQLPFRIEGDLAFGPGIADMKGGTYLAMLAVQALRPDDPSWTLPVTHVIVADEEIGSPTSRELIEAEARSAKYVLVTEPARNGGRCVTARKGIATYRVCIEGRPAHAGLEHARGRNAIRELCRHVEVIEGMTDYARGLTLNVGTIRGGTAPNVVPFSAEAEVDVRLPDPESALEVERRLRGLTGSTPDYRVDVSGRVKRPPYAKTDGITRLFETARGVAQSIGLPLEDMATSGASDANFTAPFVPTLDGLGVDGQDTSHTLQEHMKISCAGRRAALIYGLMRTLT